MCSQGCGLVRQLQLEGLGVHAHVAVGYKAPAPPPPLCGIPLCGLGALPAKQGFCPLGGDENFLVLSLPS